MDYVLLTLIICALAIFYFYFTKNYKYWQSRGIPCPGGALPFFGHMLPVLRMKYSYFQFFYKLYNDNKGRSLVGYYDFTTPSLLVLEPELVKAVLQTNFTSFQENVFTVDPEIDTLVANNPFFSKGEKWVTGRKRLTYAFSSMRLKILLESVKKVCEEFETFVNQKFNKTEKVEIELKDLLSRYTAQVVANAGFGVDGFSLDENEGPMSFRNMGKTIIEPSLRNKLLLIISLSFPSLFKIFRVGFIPENIANFFRTLVNDIMKQRKTENVVRNDFLQLMLEMEKMENDKFDTDVLASHALSFILDGFETSSSVMSFVGYHIATYPEMQEKLRKEVMSVINKYNGEITYDGLKEMTFMDQIINESQRKIHAVGFLQKLCTEECELKGSDGLVCRVKPGTKVAIPAQGLQDDPQYWEKPDEFDPDRFSPERKQNITKFTYLPFGEGPRLCVGMRMALMQIKAGLAVLLKNYKLELSPKTQVPLKWDPGALIVAPLGGIWVYIRKL